MHLTQDDEMVTSGEEHKRPGLRRDLSTCAMVDGIRVINDRRETLICH